METLPPSMTGTELREIRRQLGLSQTGFGELIGQSERTIRRYELDKWPIPRPVARLARIAATEDGPELIRRCA